MEKLTEHLQESAFDLRNGSISEGAIDTIKLTDEELQRVTGSQFFPGGPFAPSPFFPSPQFQTQNTSVFVSSNQSQAQFSPYGYPYGGYPW